MSKSLAARFRRHLNAGSVLCMYQPIQDVRTGEISGVEVLARWRDVDGSIVAPDKFIDLVVQADQTLAFTKMVADRAFQELTTALPAATRLHSREDLYRPASARLTASETSASNTLSFPSSV